MRIAEFALDGNGVWPDLRAIGLDEGLNVFWGAPQTGKSTVANFMGHVLYGRQPTANGPAQLEQLPLPEGELIITSGHHRYCLRRYNDVAPPGRLTVSSLDGEAVDQHTVRGLLSQSPPAILAQLYAADFQSDGSIERLFSEEFALGFRTALGGPKQRHPGFWGTPPSPRLEALLNRRDELTRELEARASHDRQQSQELRQHLQELAALRLERRRDADAIREKLRTAETKLSEIEALVRYRQVERIVDQQHTAAAPADLDDRLADVDAQIEQWRQILADIELREEHIRSKLASLRPDEASAAVALADQQSHLAVVNHLVTDLQVEVSRLARAIDSTTCACRDAHARMRPLLEALEKQTCMLDRGLSEQQQLVDFHDLSEEADYLARSKSELREQLEHLLARRQNLLRTARPTRRRMTRNQSPIAGNERDRQPDNARPPEDMKDDALDLQRTSLLRERQQLREQLSSAEQKLRELQVRCDRLTRKRAGLLSGVPIERIRSELASIEVDIQREFAVVSYAREGEYIADGPTSASDFLVRLSAGRFVQLNLSPEGRSVTITEACGRRISLASLSDGDCILVRLALMLALVHAHAQSGVQLPLVLDEPFHLQDERGAQVVAGVLDDFSRAGFQMMVFTVNGRAAERCRMLGHTIREMRELQCASDADVELRSAPGVLASIDDNPAHPTSLSSEPQFNASPPTDQLADFQLAVDSPVALFPALGRDTGPVFAALRVRTVGDLIQADPAWIAEKLARDRIDEATVRLWQTHQVLMCFVPGTTLDDAQVLTGAGIQSPEDLRDIEISDLDERMSAYLASARGKRFRGRGYRYDRQMLRSWCRGIGKYYDRWRNSTHGARWREMQTRARRNRTQQASAHAPRNSTQSQPRRGEEVEQKHSNMRAHLELASPVVAAPSIGPKSAARLERIGISTVAELLKADPQATATGLDTRHIKAETVAVWQQQARLACQVPQLRGHDAQILVSCGLTRPEQIAQFDPQELLKLITPFCHSKEGERILRGGHMPDLEEVTDWIRWAGKSRSLEAA